MKRFIAPFVLLVLVVIVAGFFITTAGKTEEQLKTTNKTEIASTNEVVNCSKSPLPELTEGPYYKQGSPERKNIREGDTKGTQLILSGFVLDTNCKPISNAWIDFWQADAEGNYDNTGYKLRGQQKTDEQGRYELVTVIPQRYTGRTEHIHFKIKATDNSPTITSQLF